MVEMLLSAVSSHPSASGSLMPIGADLQPI